MQKLNYDICQISWDDVIQLTKNILYQIKQEKLEIDTLVPILRGGMPLAMLLSHNLDNVKTSCLHLKRSLSEDWNANFGEVNKLGITNFKDIYRKNILVIEDIIDEGKSLEEAISIIEKYKPKNIYVATLYNFNNGKYKDVISGCYDKEGYWVVFPWEQKI